MSAKLRRHKRWLWAFLLVLSAGFVTGVWQAPVVYSQAIAPDEIRGVWMTNYGTTLMYHSTRLDEVV
ncbi:MAG: hypothetical protein AAF283_14585, partial [Cyanobacteria bacterium P01_A01_bin.70]